MSRLSLNQGTFEVSAPQGPLAPAPLRPFGPSAHVRWFITQRKLVGLFCEWTFQLHETSSFTIKYVPSGKLIWLWKMDHL